MTIPAEAGRRPLTVPTMLTVNNPQRWDMDRPYLYSAVTEVLQSGAVVDRYVTPFGIRTLTFDPGEGLPVEWPLP
jgi:beta-galactosidase